MRFKNGLRRQSLTVTQAPKNAFEIEGMAMISSFTPTNPAYTWSAVKNIDDNYYFGVMAKGFLNRDPLSWKFNAAQNRTVSGVRTALGISALNADTHRVPNYTVDGDGNIWMVCELLSATIGHGTDIKVYKTSVPYDITTLTLIETLTGSWTYPFIQISGSNVFICARGNPTGFDNTTQYYFTSTDGGANFSAPVLLYNSGTFGVVSYMWAQQDFDGGICLVLNERDNNISNWTFVAMIRGTFNSNVWTNASGSFSKNVSSSGAITRAEMIANNLVLESTNYASEVINHEGGCVKSDGTCKVLVSVQTLTGDEYIGNPETLLDELRLYTFSAGAWSFQNVDIPVTPIEFYWAYQHWWGYQPNDTAFDDIIFIDPTDNNNVYLKRSSDNFATESQRLQIPGNGKYRLGTYTPNALTIDDYLWVLVSTEGDLFEIAAETALDYSNLFIFQNVVAP